LQLENSKMTTLDVSCIVKLFCYGCCLTDISNTDLLIMQQMRVCPGISSSNLQFVCLVIWSFWILFTIIGTVY